MGCAECSHTGYKGRTGVYELMVVDDKVRALIHSRAAESQIFVAAEAGRPALDARGRRAAGRRRHHLARRSDARDARLIASAACRPTGSKPSTPPARPAPACSRPTTPRPRARSCARRRWCRWPSRRSPRPAPQAEGAALHAPRLQRHRPGGLDAPARRPGRLRACRWNAR